MPHPKPYWRRRARAVTPAPVFSAQSAPAGTVGVPYTYTFVASNTVSHALGTGALPAGLTLSSGGVLSGTPTTAAAYTFTDAATGPGGTTSSTSQSVTIAASGGTGTITVSWMPEAFDAGGGPLGTVTGFRVYYDTVSRIPSGGTYANSTFFSGASTATGTLTGLLNTTAYYVSVAAVYASGDESILDYEPPAVTTA